MKIIVIKIPAYLVTNLLFYSFRPFLQTKNKNHVFSHMLVWEGEIFPLFVYSESRSTSNIHGIQ